MNLLQMTQFLLSYRTPGETQKLELLQLAINNTRGELLAALEREELVYARAGYPKEQLWRLKRDINHYQGLEHSYLEIADKMRKGEEVIWPNFSVAIGHYSGAFASVSPGPSPGPGPGMPTETSEEPTEEPKASIGPRRQPANVADVAVGKQEPTEGSMLIGYPQDSSTDPHPTHPLLQGTQGNSPSLGLPRTAVAVNTSVNVGNGKVTVGLPHRTPVAGHSSLVIGECPNKVQRVTEGEGGVE